VTAPERLALEAHRSGLRESNAGRPAVGARRIRAGLAALGWREQPGFRLAGIPTEYQPLAARLLMTLAHQESELGRVDYALSLLAEAGRAVAPADRGNLLAIRGLVLLKKGQWGAALAALSAAEPLLGADQERLAAVLLNRGVLYLNTGDVRRARGDLDKAKHVAVGADFELIAAMATHNLGYCHLLSGDIPSALHLFDAAADVYARAAPGNLPVLATDRARALLGVGLTNEAIAELDNAIAAFRRQRLDQYCAEAELSRAQAALAVADLDAARRWSRAAMRRFRARGNDAWGALAELTLLRASPGIATRTWHDRSRPPGPRPARVAAAASQLAGRLRVHGLRADAAHADLIAARALIVAGRRDEAARQLAAAGSARTLPLEVAIVRRLARAELAVLDAKPAIALAELRAGLDMLHTRRGQLGSLDLQTGAAALGVQLADMGLSLVLDRGVARQVFAWLERSRAQAFRVRPVRPPADPEEAAVIAELRQLTVLIRAAELSGTTDLAHLARRTELQSLVRQRSWQAGGLGETTARVSLAEITRALQESGQVYAGLLVHNGRMLAITIRHGQSRLVTLGDFAVATEAARRLAADMDALAGRRLPRRLETVITESVRQDTGALYAEVVAPLCAAFGDDGVVIVPTGPLAGVPWSMLPGLRGRPVTVAPSASAWLAAWRGTQRAGDRGAGPRPLLVAGPDLRYAVREVSELASLYPGSSPLVDQDATVEKTLRALDGADLAHLAAHGHHDRDNVLFSRLDLADGPLMAYDVQRLATAPRQVVLSACDVGRTVVRPGDEILGFTAALLHIGTPTVISSVTRVADEAAVEVMTAYHRALRTGLRPAQALARASGSEPLSPFVCFGAG
jgi:tetratricopeptide (TPR) repeat protein